VISLLGTVLSVFLIPISVFSKSDITVNNTDISNNDISIAVK